MSAADKPKWVDNRTLVYTWLLIFFPVGLFAVWTGSLFDNKMRWKITGGVLAVLIFLIIAQIGLLFARIIFPAVGIYLCWKDPKIADRTTYMFAGGAVILLLIFVVQNAAEEPVHYPSPSPEYEGCVSVIKSGSCTYYRDSDCRVIARDCE